MPPAAAMSLWLQVQKENLIQLSSKGCSPQVQEKSALFVDQWRKCAEHLNLATLGEWRKVEVPRWLR